jgi:hypothetical protein
MFGGGVGAKYDRFIEKLVKSGFMYVGSGSFRTAYVRNKIVIKVPANKDGIIDNRFEAAAWKIYRKKRGEAIRLAPCRLLPNGCLMMVYASYDILKDKKPAWLKDVYDGGQGGKYRGKWVVYDYAVSLVELRVKLEKKWKVRSAWFNDNRVR